MPPADRRRRPPPAPRTPPDPLEMPITELGLSVRVMNSLERLGVFKVRELRAFGRDRLMEVENVGESTVREIHAALKRVGAPPKWRPPRKRKG